MSFYRSETVKHYKLILPRDNAQQIMQILGQKQLIHIAQTNQSDLNKPFLNQVKRINDCLLKIKDIQDILHNKSILIRRKQYTKKQYTQFFQQWDLHHRENQLKNSNFIANIDQEIQDIWHFYKQSTKRIQQIHNKIQFIRQNIAVIKACSQHFGVTFFTDIHHRFSQLEQFNTQEFQQSQVNFRAGVISLQHQTSFKKIIFRISRNNCFVVLLPFTNIFENIKHKQQQTKVVFFLLFSGTKGGYLDKKIGKLVSTYCSKDYIIPQNIRDLQKQMKILQQQYAENQHIITINQTQLIQYLQSIALFLPKRSFSKLESYKLYLLKEREIYNKLNQMQLFTNFIQADIFIQRDNIPKIQKCFQQMQQKSNYPSGQLIQTKQGKPPSLFIKNLCTNSAQMIVQTYGVPRYKQANPSFFTVITFPFLFGVMFGDMAHGALMMIFGMWLIFKKSKDDGDIIKMLVPHKYLIFLMGFFSMYCGLIYNDFLSLSLNIFGSCYNMQNVVQGQIIPRKSDQCVYPVGLDPVWNISTNYLNYVNSLKMKISVIIAIMHMTMGVFIKASNSLYFRNWIDFLFQFVPQLVFLISLFGYMDFLIIFKWLQPWQPYDSTAPSIITTMINLPLRFGQTQNCCGGQPMWGTPDHTSQNSIQLFLLILSLLCIPLMLIPKPYLLIRKNRSKQSTSDEIQQLIQQKQKDRSDEHIHVKNTQHKEQAKQIVVHQFIQTIQYVLGCISNTASYLRLWALSLAHSQLSQVLLSQTVQRGIIKNYIGIPLMIITFPIFAYSTFGILLCMDSMQCFLHTLRLHWVEFQSKFYKGDGYKFEVFSFKNKIVQEIKQS